MIALTGACGSARVLSKTNAGGVIELKGDHGKAMEDAHYTMDAHCAPGNFIITYEGPEAVATEGEESTEESGEDSKERKEPEPGTPQNQPVDTTRWRVYYRCSGQGPAPAPNVP